jgi:tetratricopeptide (TPR) repeat protein
MIRRAARTGHDWHLSLLPYLLWWHFERRNRIDDMVSSHLQALAAARRRGDREVQGLVLTALGTGHREAGRLIEAEQCFRAALVIHRRLGNLRDQLNPLTNLAQLYEEDLDRPAHSARHCRHALDIARQLDAAELQVIPLNNLAMALRRTGDPDGAVACAEEALDIVRATNQSASWECRILDTLGRAQSDAGRPADATRNLRDAITLAQLTGDKLGEGESLVSLGQVLLRHGSPEQARTTWRQAREVYAWLRASAQVDAVDQLLAESVPAPAKAPASDIALTSVRATIGSVPSRG